MSKYMLLAEGKADTPFLRDYILFRFPGAKIIKDINDRSINKSKEIKVEISIDTTIITILGIGGYTAIKRCLTTRLNEIRDFGYKILIIQDADDPAKDNGGLINRNEYLNKIKEELEIDFDIFLFPNNKENGDLETLLLSIGKPEMYEPYFSSYEKYALNLITFSKKDFCDELLQNKLRIFNYFQVYHGMEKAKEENRSYDITYWHFHSDELKSLKEFIHEIIKVQ